MLRKGIGLSAIACLLGLVVFLACGEDTITAPPSGDPILAEGRDIFRFDTFGDETFWTDTLQMHEVIRTSVSPVTALSVGLKVDALRLPQGFPTGFDLNSPATTVELLRRDAVVGLKGTVEGTTLMKVGVTCALCHSTVDNSVMAGIGQRLDGWPNRDLNPGAILALSPALQDPATQAVLQSWGPGKYDARWNHDGLNGPVVIPPAYGLRGVNLATYTGEGSIPYWNAYVAVTQMHGHGTFVDPRTGDNIRWPDDLVTSKLPALHAYQLSLEPPSPPAGSFNSQMADRGRALFNGQAQCATCHVPPLFTDAGLGLHDPGETCSNPMLATRGSTDKYRTTPLRGVSQRPPYFHDGSLPTLQAVVEHYNSCRTLGLTAAQQADLVEYLKSL